MSLYFGRRRRRPLPLIRKSVRLYYFTPVVVVLRDAIEGREGRGGRKGFEGIHGQVTKEGGGGGGKPEA